MIPVDFGLGTIGIFRLQNQDRLVDGSWKRSAERLDGRQWILTLYHRSSIESEQKNIGIFRQIERSPPKSASHFWSLQRLTHDIHRNRNTFLVDFLQILACNPEFIHEGEAAFMNI